MTDDRQRLAPTDARRPERKRSAAVAGGRRPMKPGPSWTARLARGSAVVWVAVTLPLFVSLVGLAIDGGVVFDARRELQSVADGAARAGAMQLDETAYRTTAGAEGRAGALGPRRWPGSTWRRRAAPTRPTSTPRATGSWSPSGRGWRPPFSAWSESPLSPSRRRPPPRCATESSAPTADRKPGSQSTRSKKGLATTRP